MNSSENRSNNDQKPIENNIVGYQSRKYDATIRPFKNLPINHRLLDLAESMTASEGMTVIKLWKWFQSTEIKTNGFRFRLSRAELAQIANVSEFVAQSTLAKLKRSKALLQVSTRFGVSEFVWNTGFLYKGVSEIHTAPVINKYGPCLKSIRPLSEKQTGSIICTLVLPYILHSYTSFSGHSKIVDNSDPVSLGELKDALRAGLPLGTLKDALRAGLSVGKVIGLADAVLDSWIGADRGGSRFLQDILIVIRTFKINLFTSENISHDLFMLLRDGEEIHLARKKIRNFFDNEDELIDHLIEFKKQEEK